MNRSSLVVLACAAVVLAACGGDTSVGEGLDTEFETSGTAGRLGERSEEPTPEPTAEPSPVVTQEPAPEPTQAPPPTAEPTETAPAEPQVALEVKIYSDTEGPSQFDPSLARIYQNSCIRWVNVDSVPRSVEADDGSFSSGAIAPSGEWIHCFDTPGKFNYHDGTRPYAVAAVEVLTQ